MYIGRQPLIGNFLKLDAITTSATTTFNLLNGGVAYFPQSANNCLVSLNGILQAPTDSYTISGSTIIFSSALTTSDVIDFIIVLGDVLNIGTPSDNTVSLAKLTATGTKDSTTFLRGDNTFAVPAGGVNTPAFRAFKNTTQSFSTATETKIQFESETFDTASAYDNSTNYRFTVPSGKGGKYFVTANFKIQNVNAVNNLTISVKKNGSTSFLEVKQGGDAQYPIVSGSGIVELAAADYIEAFLYHEYGSTIDGGTGTSAHFFSAFKIIE